MKETKPAKHARDKGLFVESTDFEFTILDFACLIAVKAMRRANTTGRRNILSIFFNQTTKIQNPILFVNFPPPKVMALSR
jgi:hypothetical protein